MNSDQKNEIKIQVLIAEFEKLRDEMLQNITTTQQTIVVILGSVSVAIPLLLGQISNLSSVVITDLLYTLSIIYSVISLHFISTSHNIGMIGKYIHEVTEPQINNLLKSSKGKEVLQWESFLKRERTHLINLFMSNTGTVGTVFLLLAPSLLSIAVGNYVITLPVQTSQQNPILPIVSSLSLPLLIVAWIFFSFSVISTIIGSTSYLNVFRKAKQVDNYR
jgi:hypothetical protein